MSNAKSQISAEHLGIGLEELARAAIIAQANSLLLLRQARVDLFGADDELSAKLRAGQEVFEKLARHYLSRLQPGIIKRVSDADAARNLFVAAGGVLQQRLLGPRGDLPQDNGAGGAGIVDALKNQMTAYLEDARELSRLLRNEATDAEAHSKSVADLVQARIGELDGADGAIAAIQATITETEAARAKHLDEMVSKARNVGEALKKMGIGFFEIFAGKSDSTPKTPATAPKAAASDPKTTGTAPKAADAPKAGDAPKAVDAPKAGDAPKTGNAPKAADAPKPAAAVKPDAGGNGKKDSNFAVEAITVGQEGMEGHIAAEQALKEDNKRIAALYQQLAEQGQDLAIAKAIGSQISGYASALSVMAARSDEYLKAWENLVTGLDAFRTEVTRAAASATEAKTLCDSLVNGALPTWKRLENHTVPIRDAFTGADPDAIAAVGPLSA